jgi:tetratricopeptide (TPR) repeat protein
VKRKLADAEPSNPRWQQELASSLSWLAESLYRQGRTRAAREHYRANAEILERLTASKPDNTEWRYLRSISHTKLADVSRHLGDVREALAQNLQAESLARSLVAHDPLNAEWKRDLGFVLGATARDLVTVDRAHEALTRANEARAVLSALLAGDGTNADWRRELASAENAVASAQRAIGSQADALAAVRRGRSVLEPLATNTADRVAARHRANGYLIEADVHTASGAVRASEDALAQALAAITPVAEGSTRADLLWPRAQALIRLGRHAEAQPILGTLAAQEFRPSEYTRFCARFPCEGGRP